MLKTLMINYNKYDMTRVPVYHQPTQRDSILLSKYLFKNRTPLQVKIIIQVCLPNKQIESDVLSLFTK